MTTETSTITNTYTVIIHGLGFWGCGNSYWEAVHNAQKYRGFSPTRDYHRVFKYSKPVMNVTGSLMGISAEWADGVGTVKVRDKNDRSGS